MSPQIIYPPVRERPFLGVREQDIESALIEKLRDLKYTDRPDIRDRASLEANFRQKFEALNRVRLTEGEFSRLLDELVTPDVFTAARVLREKNDFTRDDGTPLVYTLVNIRDWCKNDFEVVHQFRINTDYSHHRYDVLLLINGVPVVQIELKTLRVVPRRALEQIVEYKNDPGNGYTRTLLCFMQLFIVSNRTETVYFANNNARHFAFNADERFLPIYRFADRDNTPVNNLDDFADRFLQKCELGRMIIGLPANLFYSTGIPVCILVLKKCKKFDDVLFINAAEHFEKGKRQNVLLDEHIDKIVKTYQHRDQEDRYAERVSMERIEAEGFNLNISRYISTAVAETEIDLLETHKSLVAIDKAVREATAKHNAFLKELGLPLLPGQDADAQ